MKKENNNNNTEELIVKIKELISKAQTEKAIEKLFLLAEKENETFQKNVIIISSQYQSFKIDELRGVGTHSPNMNIINGRILELIINIEQYSKEAINEDEKTVKKLVGEIIFSVKSFPSDFISLISTPRSKFKSIFSRDSYLNYSITYSIICFVLCSLISIFLQIPESPEPVNIIPVTIAVVAIWVFISILLHLILVYLGKVKMLEKIRGIKFTVSLFLLVISSIQLIFIPIFHIVSFLNKETKITIKYDYVVSMGFSSRPGKDTQIREMYDNYLNVYYLHEESSIKEHNPERYEIIQDSFYLPLDTSQGNLSIDNLFFEGGNMRKSISGKKVHKSVFTGKRPTIEKEAQVSYMGSLILMLLTIPNYLMVIVYASIGLNEIAGLKIWKLLLLFIFLFPIIYWFFLILSILGIGYI